MDFYDFRSDMNNNTSCYICKRYVAGKGYHFPSDELEAKKWANNLKCPLPDIKNRGKNGCYKVCSEHFQTTSFLTMNNGIKRIKKTSYPLHQPIIDPLAAGDVCFLITSDNQKITVGRSFLMTVSPFLRKMVIISLNVYNV